MLTLNLDSDFIPVASEAIEFENFTFYGGEPHIKIRPGFDASQSVMITHRLNSFNDLGLLSIATDALRRMGVTKMGLLIPYFPGARQDRVMIPGEPLTVKIYADSINAMGFSRVLVFDPHSEVTPALLNNCEVIANHEFIADVIKNVGSNIRLISPDGGALKKIYKVSEFLGGAEVTECGKTRDVKTGKLSGFRVYDDDLNGADCLVVDDICDAGGTFIGLAEALKAKNAGKLYLAVSHGIFSKGVDELAKHFEMIYTTNSIREVEHSKVKQIEISLKQIF